jgi:uncharacterized protein YkwD
MKLAAWMLAVGIGAGQPLAAQGPAEIVTEPLGRPVGWADRGDHEIRSPEGGPTPTFEEEVAELVNIERQNCAVSGCPKPPLKLQTNAWFAAQEHSQSMAEDEYWSHVDMPNGCTKVGARLTSAGYTGWTVVGENIAGGQTTPANVMAGWMSSSGHKANILGDCLALFGIECPYRDLGVGYFFQAGDLANIDTNTTGAVMPPGPDCDCNDAGETCDRAALFRYWTQTFGARGGSSGYPVIIEREAFETNSELVDLYTYQPPGTGAQMQFANETGEFSTLEAFATAKSWNLTPGDGRKSVIAIVTTSSGTFRTCDRIWLDGSGDSSFIFGEGFECDGLAAWDEVAQ